MNVRVATKATQPQRCPIWMLAVMLLAVLVGVSVWMVPRLAVPMSTAAGMLGGIGAVLTARQGVGARSMHGQPSIGGESDASP
ncbi:hypothetical protein [Streptomyces virginiae]|uniref:hypothetical protein n=1 Tax=Streptomyces virginiae TaxID=1961 RepID=UPI00368F0B86